MTMPIKDVTTGVVTSIADDTLVMAAGAGGWSPIKFADLAKAVRGTLQIGGRNLIKGSGISVTNSTHLTNSYNYAELPTVGERLLATIYGTLGAGKSCFTAFNGNGDGTCGFIECLKIKDGVYQGILPILKTPNQAIVTIFASPSSVTATSTIKRVKVERGNVATDWTPAPEDIASGAWGGVNQRFTISYELTSIECEKGGAHEPSNYRSDRGAEECADGYLAFGTLESLCQFIGRAAESDFDEGSNGRIEHSQRKWGVDCSGLFQGRPLECEHKYRHQKTRNNGVAHNIQSQSKFDLQSIRNGGSGIGFTSSESSVCSNVSLDGFSITRNEVAI